MSGEDRGVVTWTDRDTPMHLPVEQRAMPHVRAAHVAAETTARLRARILTDILYGRVRPILHLDTDGVLLRRSAPLPEGMGELPGQWRVKGTYRMVDVKAPQVWRGWCQTCGMEHREWHYCVAGVSSTRAPEVFRRLPNGLRVAVRGLDMVLPDPLYTGDPVAITIEVDRARMARVSTFGAPLG
jgi:hypothetical protein